MELQDVVRRRRMVRQLSERPVPGELTETILANAQRGPSSGYTQGVEFLVFDTPSEIDRFWSAASVAAYVRDEQGTRAPLIVVPLADPSSYVENYLQRPQLGRSSAEDFPAPYWFADTGCAVMLIRLTAVDRGLGAFWLSIAANRSGVTPFKKALGIPEHLHPVGAIAIGFPDPGERTTSAPQRQRAGEARRDPGTRIHRGRSWD